MMEPKKQRLEHYESAYQHDYGFEATMVAYRQRFVLERLQAIRPAVVVEVGCGTELLYKRYLQRAAPILKWITVEPSAAFHAAAASADLPGLEAIHGFFEDCTNAVNASLPSPPDMIIASSVLHEVANSAELLTAMRGIMGPNSILHVNVPNAHSFHRQLAKSIGLIHKTTEMSERNKQLLQYRVYDVRSLEKDLGDAGCRVVATGGYFIKPFTHEQMRSVASELGANVLDGLFQMGKEHPDMASEIYAEARLG